MYVTYTTALVLQAIDAGYPYGFDVMDVTGLPSGTVYPVLRRLEEEGLLESRWEEPAVAQETGRPARRYYQVTREGSEWLRMAQRRFQRLESSLPTRLASVEATS